MLGILCLLIGGSAWGLGGFLNNSIITLFGVLVFVGGILLFFIGIAGLADKLKI